MYKSQLLVVASALTALPLIHASILSNDITPRDEIFDDVIRYYHCKDDSGVYRVVSGWYPKQSHKGEPKEKAMNEKPGRGYIARYYAETNNPGTFLWGDFG
jgi:hypothetical protein